MFELTAKQAQALKLLAAGQRHSMLVGGSRSGKTFLLTRAVVTRAIKAPVSRHAILRFRHNAVRQSIWLDTLPKVMRLCYPQVALRQHRQDGYVELPNGSEVWFGGLDDKERVEKILGMEFSTIYFNECSQIPFSSATIALTRLAQQTELTNKAFYDLNPTGTGHWTYRQFVEKKDPVTGKPLDNPEDYAMEYLNPVDNAANVDRHYLKSLEALPEKQRRRFFEGRYVAEVDGALWTLEMIEQTRIEEEDVPQFTRVAVAVDPSGASGPEDYRSDEIGITVQARGQDGHGYLLADYSDRLSPEQWGARVVRAFHENGADLIVAEKNFGGDMVRAVIHSVDSNVPVKVVTASRGKVIRAEPIAALYEQGKIHHLHRFSKLEDQLTNFSTSGYMGDRSPDRADAAVWGFTELMLGHFGHEAW